MNQIRIGILGASKIAPLAVIAPAKTNPAVVVSSIAARDPARATAFAKAHDIPSTHESYAALIRDPDVDLVYNSLPPKYHRDWTIAALSAGKHVLLEKPSGMSSADADAMVDAARRANRRLIEAFHYRYHPLFARVLDIAKSQIGALQSAEAVFEVPIPSSPDEIRYDADLGGGALMDLGCYPVHWLRALSGEEPEIVSAAQTLDAGGADIATSATLRFPSGFAARLSCSMQPASGRPMASLQVRGSAGEMTVLNPLAPQFGHLLSWTGRDGLVQQETFPQRATYDYQLDAVVDALVNGTGVPTEGDDIVATMRVLDAIRSTARMKAL